MRKGLEMLKRSSGWIGGSILAGLAVVAMLGAASDILRLSCAAY